MFQITEVHRWKKLLVAFQPTIKCDLPDQIDDAIRVYGRVQLDKAPAVSFEHTLSMEEKDDTELYLKFLQQKFMAGAGSPTSLLTPAGPTPFSPSASGAAAAGSGTPQTNPRKKL